MVSTLLSERRGSEFESLRAPFFLEFLTGKDKNKWAGPVNAAAGAG